MVARTGFFTAKGELLRLMFPKHDRTRFAADALAFIGLMLLLGIAGYAWSVSSLVAQGMPIGILLKPWNIVNFRYYGLEVLLSYIWDTYGLLSIWFHQS
jgi:hypothetical protein